MKLTELSQKISKPVPMRHREPMAYLERARVSVSHNKVVAYSNSNPDGLELPVGSIGCLLLGPGTSITNEAVKIAARRDCCILWSGGGGIPIHCFSGNYRSPKNLLLQASLMVDEPRRLEIGRKLLLARNSFLLKDFHKIPAEEVSKAKSIQELLLVEARWAKTLYREQNTAAGLMEHNKLLKLANFMCYGLVTPLIINLGFNPNIGILHGQNRGGGPIFDIADLIKPTCSLRTSIDACLLNLSENEIKSKVLTAFAENNFQKRLIALIVEIYGLGD